MSQTLTLIRSKADIAIAAPQLNYSTSSVAPTVSALANHLGLLDQELATEPDLDVHFSRQEITDQDDSERGEGHWIRDSELASVMKDRASGGDNRLLALAFLEVSLPVVALTSSRIRSIADLKGRRLGIVTTKDGFRDLAYARQLKVYKTALGAGGLTLHDVRFVPFEGDKPHPIAFRAREKKIKSALEVGRDIAERLQRHEFDAIAVDAASDVAHHASIRILYDTLEHPDYLARAQPDTLRGVVVSGRLLRERRDLVVRLLARLLQAAEWARSRPKDVTVALAGSFDINFDDLTGKYKNLSEGLQINLGDEKIVTLEAQKNFLVRHQLIPRNFDIHSWIDHGPLVEAHLLFADWKKSGRLP